MVGCDAINNNQCIKKEILKNINHSNKKKNKKRISSIHEYNWKSGTEYFFMTLKINQLGCCISFYNILTWIQSAKIIVYGVIIDFEQIYYSK